MKKIKNGILGNVNNVGSIVIGDQVHYHVYKDEVKESKVMSKESVEKIQQSESTGEVFIMYSWDSEDHKDRVLSFWKTLRENGFDAVIDRQVSQENSAADFDVMMHRAITDYDKVIIFLSEGYAKKANAFKGGVGFEYSMVIKDIKTHLQKYLLVTFDKITDSIFPVGLTGREVLQISVQADLDRLFRKLMDVPEFEIPEVSSSKPELKSKEIPPLFSMEGLIVSELRPKSGSGSLKAGQLYFRHIQAISVIITNKGTKTIEGFKVKVEIPKSLTKNDPKAEIINNNRIFVVQDNQKLYPDESTEINCGETYIHHKDVEDAFKSEIKVTLLWDGGKSEFKKPINTFLLGTGINGKRKVLKLSDFLG